MSTAQERPKDQTAPRPAIDSPAPIDRRHFWHALLGGDGQKAGEAVMSADEKPTPTGRCGFCGGIGVTTHRLVVWEGEDRPCFVTSCGKQVGLALLDRDGQGRFFFCPDDWRSVRDVLTSHGHHIEMTDEARQVVAASPSPIRLKIVEDDSS